MVNIVRKILIVFFVMGLSSVVGLKASAIQEPVDYVNPYMGNISHLLVPTYPICLLYTSRSHRNIQRQ